MMVVAVEQTERHEEREEHEEIRVAVEAELAAVCGGLNVAHARLVALVAQVVESGCWAGAGIHSCEQWVALQTGLSPGRARQVVLLAHRQAELPHTFAAFEEGALTVDQVAVIARHAPAAYEADVAQFARAATVTQLRRTLSRYAFDADATRADVRPGRPEGQDRPFVAGGFDDDGRYRLRALLDADEGAVVDAALREAHDRLFRRGHPDVTQADALVEVARRSLGAIATPARRDAYRVVLHVRAGEHGASVHDGPMLPDALRRQLLCDADGLIVTVRDGRPVDVGRVTRTVPLALRRLVEHRDRGCRVPGCTRRRVQVHHLVHWEDGGPTNSSNLVALCHKHHRLHHQGVLGISGDPERDDGLTFTDARGRPVAGRPPAPPPPGGAGMPRGRWTRPTGERLQTRWVDFAARPTTAHRPGGGERQSSSSSPPRPNFQ